MGNPRRQPAMTAKEFLAWEQTQQERHEFVNGEVFAMAGAGEPHATVSLNLAVALHQHLADTPCRTFMAEMKLAAADESSYFYPDVFVTCSQADRKDAQIKREPTLIVEVLSPGTAAYDLGDKFAYYRAIATLNEIAFVDLDARRTDVYRKGSDGRWVLDSYGRGAEVTFASVNLTISAAALFAKVDEA